MVCVCLLACLTIRRITLYMTCLGFKAIFFGDIIS